MRETKREGGLPRVVAGVFGNVEDAEAAVSELRQLGLMDEDLGLAIPEPERYPGLKAETRAIEELKGVAEGVAIGTPIGSLAGMALAALVIPGAGVLAIGVVGALTGALWGAYTGAAAGFTAKVRLDADENLWSEIPLKSGDILLVAHAREAATEAHDVMHRHGVKCFVGETCPESEPATVAKGAS